jgi:uncharacterized protein (TIGR03000 family)
MYSLILMTAMASSPDTTSFGWRSASCYGCTGASVGCTGSVYTSCTGCYGSSCYGSSCYGSSCSGPAFPILHNVGRATLVGAGRIVTAPFRLFSCHGGSSCSGCYGSTSCTGCFGSSCYGAWGSSCLGSSCYGSCYGSGCVGSGCYGSSTPVIIGSAEPVLEHFGTISLSGNTNTIVAAKPLDAPEKASANLSLTLPKNAKLFVDGNVISGDGESRQFHTPELPVGQTFFYDIKAIIEVNGKMEVEEKRVVVKAGETLRETFPKLIAAVKNPGSPSVASR